MFADPAPFVYDTNNDVQQTRDFYLTSVLGSTTQRHYHSDTPGLSQYATIQHQLVGKGAGQRNRSVFTVKNLQVVDSVESVSVPPIVLYIVADIPLSAQHAWDVGITDAWKTMCGFLRGRGGLVNSGQIDTVFRKFVEGQG